MTALAPQPPETSGEAQSAASLPAPAPGTDAPVAIGRPTGLVPNIDADNNVERFVVAGATALISLRIYLHAMNYPQVGGDGLHIAHMLWGGLLLTVSLLMSVSFLGRRVRGLAVIAGGAGFGIFIDELGKFITSDNNYFFKPAVPLIYAVFVLLYVSLEWLLDRYGPRPDVQLPQAADLIADSTIRPLSIVEWTTARHLLLRGDPANPLTPLMLTALDDVDAAPSRRAGFVARCGARLHRGYEWLIEQPWMVWLVVALALIHIAFGARELLRDLSGPGGLLQGGHLDWSIKTFRIVGRALSSLLIVVGLVTWRKSRLEGYEWMKRGVLFSLLLVQPMTFYVDQVSGAWSLALNLTLLAALNFALAHERVLAAVSGRLASTKAGSAPAGR